MCERHYRAPAVNVEKICRDSADGQGESHCRHKRPGVEQPVRIPAMPQPLDRAASIAISQSSALRKYLFAPRPCALNGSFIESFMLT